MQTFVVNLVDLTPMRLFSSDNRGTNLQQEPSLETNGVQYITRNAGLGIRSFALCTLPLKEIILALSVLYIRVE